MVKGLSISVLVVTLAACTAVADISPQIQAFDLNLLNGALQTGGDGVAANTNLGILELSQLGTDNVRHTTAYQGFNGAISQVAGAMSSDGASGVGQLGDLTGWQIQNPTTGNQLQAVGSNLNQNATQLGTGSILGVQTAVGVGIQLIFTPYGASANIQALGDVLYGASAGGPCGSATINNGGSFQAGQSSIPW